MAIWLITGASSGIGEQLARLAVRRGDTVFGVARRKEKLDAMARELGDRFIPFVCDVADKAQVRQVCATLPALPDTAILNAGIGAEDSPRSLDVSIHERVFAVNYFGILFWIEELLPRFAERGSGVFVGTSSLAALFPLPLGAAYSAGKAALSVALASFRLTYWRQGVRFVTVHPGFVDTPMTQRIPAPKPFLWSPEKAARYIMDKLARGVRDIRFPWPMRLLIRLARLLPTALADRLFRLKDSYIPQKTGKES